MSLNFFGTPNVSTYESMQGIASPSGLIQFGANDRLRPCLQMNTNSCIMQNDSLKLKKVIWLGTRRDRIQAFARQAQDDIGYELFKVQPGMMPRDWRPMPGIGPGVAEIRVHQPREHRLIYVATLPEAIYVLLCFEKKANKTTLRDLSLARARYVELQKIRQEEGDSGSKK